MEQEISIMFRTSNILQRYGIGCIADEDLLVNVYAGTDDYVSQLAAVNIYVDACAG